MIFSSAGKPLLCNILENLAPHYYSLPGQWDSCKPSVPTYLLYVAAAR